MTHVSGNVHLIGVDVGGTKVAAGLVSAAGEITCQTRTPMAANNAVAGLAAVISAIDAVRAAAHSHSGIDGPISGIGICAPGPLDPRTGIVINHPNLPGWRNFPLAAEISKIYSLPVESTMTEMRQRWRKPCGVRVAAFAMSSAPRSARALELVSYSMAAFITAAPVRPRRVVTIPSDRKSV